LAVITRCSLSIREVDRGRGRLDGFVVGVVRDSIVAPDGAGLSSTLAVQARYFSHRVS
jgi:hypothetical protein